MCDLRDDVCRPAACTACTAGESPFRGAAVVDRSERGTVLESEGRAGSGHNLVCRRTCLVADSDVRAGGVHEDEVPAVFWARDFVEVRSRCDALDDFLARRRSEDSACNDRSCTVDLERGQFGDIGLDSRRYVCREHDVTEVCPGTATRFAQLGFGVDFVVSVGDENMVCTDICDFAECYFICMSNCDWIKVTTKNASCDCPARNVRTRQGLILQSLGCSLVYEDFIRSTTAFADCH